MSESPMKLRAHYIHPNTTEATWMFDLDGYDDHRWDFIHHMVQANQDCIFYLTVETTDIP